MIRAILKGLWGTAGTWLSAFNGPCLWACLAAAGVAGAGSGWLVRGHMDSKVARAELATANAEAHLVRFTGELATNAAETERAVGGLLAEAERKIAARDAAAYARLLAIPGEVAKQLQPELLAFRSAINADPRLTCLDLPLPDAALRVLERPGGQARPDSPAPR